MEKKLTPERVEGLRRAISENEENGRSLAWHEVEDILSIFSDFAKRMTVAPPTSPGLLSAEDERALFEKWWAKEQGDRMKGSKYLARNAWLAALWTYGVKTTRLSAKPAAPQAEVTEEERAEMGRVLGEMIHSYPVGLTIYVAESDVGTLRKARALILATAPGSTAGKPAPARVSREQLIELADDVLSRWQKPMDAVKFIGERLRELGIVVEPDKEG